MSDAQGSGNRRELDGLRGLAILCVMVYHTGLPGFKGAYLGVDIVFVLSGYLLTRIAVRAHHDARFSARDFIARRARRIAPALCAALVLTLPAAWWLLPMRELESFAHAMLSVLALGSNLLFWRTQSYFEPAAEWLPWIHAWSLSVEEQFYLAYAAVLMACLRHRVLSLRIALWIGGLVSLATWVWAVMHSPAAAHYLMPTRAWEFCLGALIGEREVRLSAQARACPVAGSKFDWWSGFGLALLILSMVLADVGAPHLARWAPLGAAAATALIITHGSAQAGAGRLLSARALCWVGLCSYSAYLLHQPVFAFLRHASLDPLPTVVLVASIPVVLVAAWWSWRWIETPFRDRSMRSSAQVLAWCLGGALIVLLTSAWAWATHGLPSRYDAASRQILSYADFDFRPSYSAGRCFIELGRADTASTLFRDCPPMPGAEITVVGDSYAAALAAGLRATGVSVTQWTVSGCIPGGSAVMELPLGCGRAWAEVRRLVAEQQPRELWIHAHWLRYGANLEEVDAVTSLLQGWSRDDAATVVRLIGTVPHWHGGLPRRMVRTDTPLVPGARLPSTRAHELEDIDQHLSVAAERLHMSFISARDVLCNRAGCEVTALDKDGVVTPLSWDDGHLGEAGGMRLARALVTMTAPERAGQGPHPR